MTDATPDPDRQVALEAAADRLIAAAAEGRPCPPVRELVPAATLGDGYAFLGSARGVFAATKQARTAVAALDWDRWREARFG